LALQVIRQLVRLTLGTHLTMFVIKLEGPAPGIFLKVDGALVAGTTPLTAFSPHFSCMQLSFNIGIVANVIKRVDVDHLDFVITFLDFGFGRSNAERVAKVIGMQCGNLAERQQQQLI